MHQLEAKSAALEKTHALLQARAERADPEGETSRELQAQAEEAEIQLLQVRSDLQQLQAETEKIDQGVTDATTAASILATKATLTERAQQAERELTAVRAELRRRRIQAQEAARQADAAQAEVHTLFRQVQAERAQVERLLAAAQQERRKAAPGEAVRDADGAELRPNPLGAETPAQLIEALRQFRVWAGEPSFRDMDRLCEGRAAASTMCTALRRDDLPRLQVVLAIVTACGGSQEDHQRFATAWRTLRLAQGDSPPIARSHKRRLLHTLADTA